MSDPDNERGTPTMTATEATPNVVDPDGLPAFITVDEMFPSGDNVREDETTDIEGLMESIVMNGLVTAVTMDVESKTLIAGHRRRQAILLGIERGLLDPSATYPVMWRYKDEGAGKQLMYVENQQRVGLDPVEEARTFKDMSTSLGLKPDEIAKRVGKSTQLVKGRLELLRLPAAGLSALKAGLIDLETARAYVKGHRLFPTVELFHEWVEVGLSQQWGTQTIDRKVEELELQARAYKVDKGLSDRGITVVADLAEIPAELYPTEDHRPAPIHGSTVSVEPDEKPDLDAIANALPDDVSLVQVQVDFRGAVHVKPIEFLDPDELRQAKTQPGSPAEDQAKEAAKEERKRQARRRAAIRAAVKTSPCTKDVAYELLTEAVLKRGISGSDAQLAFRLLGVESVQASNPQQSTSDAFFEALDGSTPKNRTKMVAALAVAIWEGRVRNASATTAGRYREVLASIGVEADEQLDVAAQEDSDS